MGPLEGVKVVELGVWVAGPAAGAILADWGADVIKIEPPGVGDPARLFSSMFGVELPFNPPFEMDNRGKRDIVVDLSDADGREIGLELIDAADVFVTNVRQSGLARLGFDSKSLLERNPRLVYGAITGYGLEGPDKDRAAYDIAAFWARSGIAHMLTAPDASHPPFQRGGMGDHNAGLAAAGGISAALFARERTGKGRLVSTSLLREGLYTLSFDLATTLRFGMELGVAKRDSMGNPCINNYKTADGKWFWVVGLEAKRHWPPLARVVGHPEWIDDEKFSSIEGRMTHTQELISELDKIFATKTLDDWQEEFAKEEDFWWAPVQSLEQVIADPQVHAAGGFLEVPDEGTTTLLPATPVDFDGERLAPKWMAPSPGQHTDEIMSELGKDDATIDRLRKAGAIG